MQRAELVAFIRDHRLAVVASVSAAGTPQAAVVGIGVSDELEIVFDTLDSTRKCKNLRERPEIALVIGGPEPGEACTLQLEGLADEPRAGELARLKQAYFASFPDGVERERWAGITYFRVRPRWLRFSDYRGAEPRIVELDSGLREIV